MAKTKNVTFATPTYSHSVSQEYFQAVLAMFPVLSRAGINSGFSMIGGDQFIAKARNLLVGMFLAHEDTTDLFFLDDDVGGWTPEQVVKFITRPEDIILGAYPKKQEDRDFPIELQADLETGTLIERDGLIKVNGGPTGFMRIRRHVLEVMAAKAGIFLDNDREGNERRSPNIFRCGVGGEDKRFYGEDWAFCQDAQELGFEVWCDPNIDFTHRGNRVWRDNLSHHLDVYRDKARIASEAHHKAKAEQESSEKDSAAA